MHPETKGIRESALHGADVAVISLSFTGSKA
jgi:hypothetical protein